MQQLIHLTEGGCSFQVDPFPPPPPEQPNFTRTRGKRTYELTNHLEMFWWLCQTEITGGNSPKYVCKLFKGRCFECTGIIILWEYDAIEKLVYKIIVFGYQGSEKDNDIKGIHRFQNIQHSSENWHENYFCGKHQDQQTKAMKVLM